MTWYLLVLPGIIPILLWIFVPVTTIPKPSAGGPR